ncbi:MAG: hypothetical protein H0X29_05860, partial [Parachlamydiaceae bacterium]|nr:hypothetical protein [Parachlamydiaceae bacterium]
YECPNDLLGRNLDYFLEAKRSPSPLMTEWISPILGGNSDELQAMISKNSEDPFQPIYDDYLKWMGRNAANVDTKATIKHWQGKAQDLFVDLSTHWYPKLHKAARGAENDIV